MIQMSQKLNLTKRSLGIHVVIKSVRYFLYRNELIRLRIQHRASNFKTRTKIQFISTYKTESYRNRINKTKQNKLDQDKYQTIPYAPRPIGMIGGRYLAVISNKFPNILYCINWPPCVGTAGKSAVWPTPLTCATSAILLSLFFSLINFLRSRLCLCFSRVWRGWMCWAHIYN